MMKNVLFLSAILIPAIALGILSPTLAQQTSAEKSVTEKTALTLTSPDFLSEDSIPAKYTCDGANTAPVLNWQGVPDGTKSFALIIEDPDASAGTWTHWVVYNITADTKTLPPLPPNVHQGKNSAGKNNYGGPCPPKGTGVHRYFFRLYALDATLDNLPEATTGNSELQQAMKDHILARAELMGRYTH